MPKAIISNRIYLDVDAELKQHLIETLTYKIEKKALGRAKIKIFDTIKNYKLIKSNIMSIPSGRLDLIPDDYEIIDKRVTEDVPFPNPKFDLREDQEFVVNSIEGTCLINALVGWGKTFTALHLARKLGQKTLVITHTTMLRDQWIKEIEKLFGMRAGVIGSGKFDIDHAITVGNVQSVTKMMPDLAKEFGTLIIDEMHHTVATTFSAIIDASYAKNKIGLSGTMLRTDGKHVLFKDFFGFDIHQPAQAGTLTPSIKFLNTGMWLDPSITVWAEKVNKVMYDYDYQAFVAAAAKVQQSKGHKVLIIGDRVEFLENVKELLGETCLCITGKLSDFETRESEIKKIYTGEADYIAGSRQIFSEGISVNPLSCVIIACLTSNPISLEQIIGRIQRMYEGKLNPVVVDITFSGPEGKKQARLRKEFYERKGWEMNDV